MINNKRSAKKGILLIHGLMSSPLGMSSLRDYFEAQGYLVDSVLLPGHGTKPSDLQQLTYDNWLDTCRSAIKKLREKVEYLTVVAFSAGTTLAIYLSLTENSIDSLVLFAPALALTSPLMPLLPLFYRLRNYCPCINWIISHEEDDYAKYQSLPINAVYQINLLMSRIQKILKHQTLTIPIYIISSEDDETISHQKAIAFFLQQKNPLNRGVIYTTNFKNYDSLPNSLILRKSNYPEQNILDFSHTALAVAPNHTHYGKQGDYQDFTHYSKKAREKLKEKPVYYGAASRRNIKGYHLQRLSYNPDFDFLIHDIYAFLSNLS